MLDRILATGNAVGVRVVIPITNQYPWHGGYTDLAALRGKPAIVSYLLQRRNTITGVRYADDKAVLAWAYDNEPNSATDEGLTEMGRHINALPAHRVPGPARRRHLAGQRVEIDHVKG